VKLKSNLPQVSTVCAGDCTTGFAKDATVTSDIEGNILFSLQIVGGFDSKSTVYESIDGQSPDTCKVAITTTVPTP
jgi:hypothetical protein